VHNGSYFYAQNVSLIPLYNRFHTRNAVFIPEGYSGKNVNIDPDLPIYYHNWVNHVANSVAQALDIDSWANINLGGIPVSFTEWQHLDLFTREAIKTRVDKIFSEREKQAKQAKADLEAKLKSDKEYSSPFNNISKPSFFQQ
jgi:hypothetical protein